MYHMFNGHGWGMGFGWIFGLIILIAIIWFVYKALNTNQTIKSGNKSSMDILKERYARGEIDKQEFEERKKDLQQ